MSSVGSAATLSPTSSSGAHFQPFNNWGDINLANAKREELPHTSATEELARLPLQNYDSSGDTDRSSSVNTDSTPIAQLNLQLNLGNLNGQNNTGQGNANAILSARHVASSFAINALKSNPTKAQSDKTGIKDRKNFEFPVKDELSLTKRSSIERSLENTHNLAQSLLQNGNNGQAIQSHVEAEKINGEQKQEIKREKLHINTNLLSSSDKASLSNQGSATLPVPQQKSQESTVKNAVTVNIGKNSSTPTNLGHSVDQQFENGNSQTEEAGMLSVSQPVSMVINKSSVATISSLTSTSNLTSNNTISQGHTPINNNAQNMQRTLTQQSSSGNLQIKPAELANGLQSEKLAKSSSTMQSSISGVENNSKQVVKLDTIPHSTHSKLQSVELFEKIKVSTVLYSIINFIIEL